MALVVVNEHPRSWTSRDFESILGDVLRGIPVQSKDWTNLNTTDPGVQVCIWLAAELDKMHFLTDGVNREMRWKTAILRQSLIDQAAAYGYVPPAASAATADVTLTLASVLGGDFLIPVGTQFETSPVEATSEAAVLFESSAAVTILAGNTVALVSVAEGVSGSESLGTSDGTPYQSFPIIANPIIDGSLVVTVDEGAGPVAWILRTSFGTSSSTDLHYTISRDDEENVTVKFGGSGTGKIPTATATVASTFRKGGGSLGNVGDNTITTLVSSLTFGGVPVTGITVTNSEAASGGAPRATLEEIRRGGPEFITTLGRAVTPDDHKNMAKTVAGVARASVSTTSLNCCTVSVCVVPDGGGVPSQALKDSVGALFNGPAGDGIGGVSMAGRTVVVCDGTQIAVDLRGVVHVNATEPSDDIEAKILAVVDAHLGLDSNFIDFGVDLRLSNIYADLDGIDGVSYVNLTEYTRQPAPVLVVWQPAGPSFGGFKIGSLAKEEIWSVVWTSPTTYSVSGDISGVQTTAGTIGAEYSSDDAEITFTLTPGVDAPVAGDNATVRTSPKLGDIIIDSLEIPVAGITEIIIEGGAAGGRTC